ncbi:MAG: Jag N-terminal domain-containing protein [Candidatus Omnitrophica bacterium]|nr:Jag N-terminal domain-containing protein [Candidatus Omnitrophota bacterium]MDD5488716.1 Jag N-terminal domain-containing protein [Candidatus Omnitrophota bacterium]
MKKNITQIEVEDVTVEKAIRKALKTLNAKEQEVSVKVLKEGHKGLFGMKGAEHAKIRVTVIPKTKVNT